MSFVPDTQNKEFQDALNLIQYTRQSVFLTGKAGTGKSTFLKYICANTKKKHVVLAPTGIAAINAGGSTLHSFFKLPSTPCCPMTRTSVCNGDASTNFSNTPNPTANYWKNWNWSSSTRFPWYAPTSSTRRPHPARLFPQPARTLWRQTDIIGGRCVPVGTRRQRR